MLQLIGNESRISLTRKHIIMDEIQFLQLIDQHQGAIHKICMLYTDSREDREALFQEIVFQLLVP